jgi:predicted permease
MRLQLAEAFAVALAAGVLAVILAAVTLPLLIRAAPDDIPRLGSVTLDAPTLAATFGIVILVALACGVVPAVRASSPDLAGLREAGRGSTGKRAWFRNVLVVGQTALALMLLIGSALLVESFERLRHVDPGYDVNNIYTFQFAPDQPGLRDGPSLGHMHLAFMDRLRALPGVTMVGVVNNIPLDEATPNVRVRTEGMAGSAEPMLLNMNFAGGDVFKALHIPVLQGRAFTNAEAITPNNSVIVSRSAAERLWPGQNPIGRSLRPTFGRQDTLTFNVVGVVGDVKQNDWRDAGQSVLYFPLTGPTASAWGMGSPAYVVKGPAASLLRNQVRALVREIAPEAPVYREFTMESLARRSMVQLSFTTLTLGVVSALALILGVVGLYGVLSYVVAQRTREIGVRMALGATAVAVRAQVVSQGARVVLVGVVIGIIGALVSTRVLGRLLYGVKAADPIVFAVMSMTMIGMGVLASYVPARRASNVNPIEALRSD